MKKIVQFSDIDVQIDNYQNARLVKHLSIGQTGDTKTRNLDVFSLKRLPEQFFRDPKEKSREIQSIFATNPHISVELQRYRLAVHLSDHNLKYMF